MTTLQFKTASLFGGAISVDIPQTWADVSEIREVPDTQEVYLDRDGFSSIVVDILERVDKPTDGEALEYHLSDIIDEDLGEAKIRERKDASLRLMPSTPVFTLIATTPPGARQRGRPNEPDFVGVIMILIRLKEQKTDIVVTVNVPHLPNSYDENEMTPEEGKLGPLMESASKVKERVLDTFEVKDFGLFIEE
ncbi:unnamed protein product [Zymoseptoria tritici ST99CH_1A5]|uniref:Ran-interacting Mog1 protein n=4 Tax=Zymoseptoria tritici TaxID=1047171 RepID=F9XMV4_ZYMTI|nr:uncharacterized protein MYCGRDRAFT_49805 [Zymoseptoria tritici IPO323]SMQ55163.1 unnamed protein product [Zymoseptoria tritici ST99CH_3D7]SMR60374.1 unnamed protein product [Zymoseptoria tritici ST99CH_1E4]SMR63486.1 unnamed protein product [Zymoseptoria tritici ST99CH_3D1]SMY28830.1 unnamed protein product [Zymoseptoria tritici ST99CH_1A5]EGP83627.1 hypothetical protein MYCGRDRAFT_49805 [Zymoseptoria tritici IPO323]